MNRINYDKIFRETAENLDGKKSLLLHVCCAPCSSAVLERVVPHFDVTLFFYNPNITDENEYHKRLNELVRFIKTAYGEAIPIVDGGYMPETFYGYSAGLEKEREGGARCFKCYRERLTQTAKYAKDNNFDFFCTTLSVSPYKNAEKLNEIGGELAETFEIRYLFSDFKKEQGYVRSIELSKFYGLYRQNYCGCEYSH